jgi:hypothetical protein
MDMPAFSASLKRLGRVMSRVVADDLVEDYFVDLKEFPLDTVDRALDHVRKSARFWPRPGVIREACLLVPGVRSATCIPSWVDPVAEAYFCSDCSDSGFVRGLECAGDGRCHVGHCGQQVGQTGPHPYIRRCGCVRTNPVLMRERDIQRQRTAGAGGGRE